VDRPSHPAKRNLFGLWCVPAVVAALAIAACGSSSGSSSSAASPSGAATTTSAKGETLQLWLGGDPHHLDPGDPVPEVGQRADRALQGGRTRRECPGHPAARRQRSARGQGRVRIHRKKGARRDDALLGRVYHGVHERVAPARQVRKRDARLLQEPVQLGPELRALQLRRRVGHDPGRSHR
jgi:hypothetical protein